MNSKEIRKSFLDFFSSKGHAIVPSDSLIPKGDPTLLFTTAGMVQFKPLYAGAPLQFSKAATCQKCLRAGGKGSDLENVGRTLRHHTFFEMLGNFSFGDYFKEEAILWAWEYLTDVVKLPKDRLWPSVYKDDQEAFMIWNKKIGLPKERIIRLGEKDNFWGPAGDTGACGPSSEIYYDLGIERGCGKKDCAPGCDCERYIEIWNLVFPQFNQQKDGSRPPLARRGIDTGMGLERISFVSGNLHNNYQSDLFKPIIDEIARYTSHAYQQKTQMAYHVIADHIRALTFAIADHIVPSNEGRGYVLRRILRRASRYAQKIDLKEPFLFKIVAVVAELMKEPYPELIAARENVARMIKFEEEKFLGTIVAGLNVLEDLMSDRKKKMISGEDLFRLYDTYGFPVEMAKEMADEEGFSIDEKAFQKLMVEQKERSKASWVGSAQTHRTVAFEELKTKIGVTEFLGYQTLSCEAKILVMYQGEKDVSEVSTGEQVEIVLNQTPFYGESGGQVGDRGTICSKDVEIDILDCQCPVAGLTLHSGIVKKGTVKVGDTVSANVEKTLRSATARHHTSTHLLNYALRRVLGDHVKQSGSLVSPDRFRFDFTHFEKIKDDELKEIESIVNEKIVENFQVQTQVISIDEAKKAGALAFFGEKYGKTVRMVSIGDFSKELCGGTHVKAVGEIGLFRIVGESSVASGIRRIEAVSGLKAYENVRDAYEKFSELCVLLNVSHQEAVPRMEKILSEKRKLEKELQNQKSHQAKDSLDEILKKPLDVKGEKLYVGSFERINQQALRELGDYLKSKIESGIIALLSSCDGKVFILSMVTQDLVKKGYHAGKIVQALAKIVDGGGGGKPEIAQAGGKDPSKIEEALKSMKEMLS